MVTDPPSGVPALGRFATRHALSITFIAAALCVAGVYAARHMPSAVFPQTDFPRVFIEIENGVMPADEMMATITRPVEETMKEIPGVVTVRSRTSRGSAEVNVFFNWRVDMTKSELFVLGHLAEIRSSLPATVETAVSRLTFASFPILGVSLTSTQRPITELWEKARYELKPRFLRIPGVALVDLVGGGAPEWRVVADPFRMQASNVTLPEIADAIERSSLIAPVGMRDEDYQLYLTTVDGRVHSADDIARLVVALPSGHPVRIGDVARVERGPEPAFTVVTADGVDAVLLNIHGQPDASTLDIAGQFEAELHQLRGELPADMKLGIFYDESLFVRESLGSVLDAIGFGLILSVLILYFFLKSWGSTVIAVVVIPVTVLTTLVAMKLLGMSFNLMTLGGIAAAIGLVIDDAIVVVEAMCVKIAAGRPRLAGIQEAVGDIFRPLVGSTLTPVVVFIPLAVLTGVAGVFFRALAITMVVALLTSLILAVTLTPALAAWFFRDRAHLEHGHAPREGDGGFLLSRVNRLYERVARAALRRRGIMLAACAGIILAGLGMYRFLASDFLPPLDEGGFIIDYLAPPGTGLNEMSRQLSQAEDMLRAHPDVQSYSRRTGTELGPLISAPNTGDFSVKLKPDRRHTTQEVIADFRHRLNEAIPDMEWEFPGLLGDVIGDLEASPEPIEIKLFSADVDWLKKTALHVEEVIQNIPGVVDVYNGLKEVGPSLNVRVRQLEARRFGLTVDDIASAVNHTLQGRVAADMLEGDRRVGIRVLADPKSMDRGEALRDLPLRTPTGGRVKLSQVADIRIEPGQLELYREDLRQNVSVTARLEGRDLGGAMAEIRRRVEADPRLAPGDLEFGGIYRQQQESFRNLLLVLIMAVFLVFTVLLVEFRSFLEPVAIVFGAVLALVGTVAGLWITGTTLNIVSFLGAIIGVGIVAKNGILMLDSVARLRAEGMNLDEALIRSGHRRLRPVLMTSLAAGLGMLPLAWGVGSGADMLRPLAIAVIGALCISVLLSLVATPIAYHLLSGIMDRSRRFASRYIR